MVRAVTPATRRRTNKVPGSSVGMNVLGKELTSNGNDLATDVILDASSTTLNPSGLGNFGGQGAVGVGGISKADEALFSILCNYGAELDEFIDAVFARYKFMEVIGTWLVILVSDASVNFPVEWVVFCFLSLFSYYRAFQTHVHLLLLFSFFIGFLDMLTYIVLVHYAAPGWLPTAANMMVFGYMVCSVRGFDAVSWSLWLIFVSFDVFGRDLFVSDFFTPLAVHCVGYGLYLLATEAVGSLVDKNGKHSAKEYERKAVLTGETAAFVGRLILIENRLEVCIEAITAMSFSASLGFISFSSSSSSSPTDASPSPSSSSPSSPVIRSPFQFFFAPSSFKNNTTFSAFTATGQLRHRLEKERAAVASLLNALPPVHDWNVPDKDVFVLLNDEPVPMDCIKLFAGGDEGPGLIITSLSPATAYKLRVFVRFPQQQFALSSLPIAFITPDSPPQPKSFSASASAILAIENSAAFASATATSPFSSALTTTTATSSSSSSSSSLLANLTSNSEVAAAETQVPNETDLERQLEHERTVKKEQQAMIKRMKREFQKQEAAIKAEITVLQNSLLKDETKEKRDQRRMDSLRQSTKQLEGLTQELESEIDDLRAKRQLLSESVDKLRIELANLKDQLQKADRAQSKALTQHAKVMAELEKDFTRASKDAADQTNEVLMSKQALASHMEQLAAMHSEIISLQEEQVLARKDAEHLVLNESQISYELDNNRQSLERSINALLAKNRLLRETLTEEVKFKQKLLEELNREGIE